MNNQSILMVVLIFLVGYIVVTEVSKRWKAYRQKKEEAEGRARVLHDDLVNHISRLVISFEKSSSNDADATKLLAGTLKACEAIAQCTLELREEIGKFSKLIGGDPKDKTYPEDNVAQPMSEEEANKTGVFIEALLRGIPVKQAEQEAADAEEKKMAYSAVSMGPED